MQLKRVNIPVKLIIGDSISYTATVIIDVEIGTEFVGTAGIMSGNVITYNELGKALQKGVPAFLRELADYYEATVDGQ